MYKCSECGTEYEIMPKYCDCGNDIFFLADDVEVQEIDDDFLDDDISDMSRRRNLSKKSFSPASVSIFVLCIILSLLVLFVIGNPKKDVSENNSKSEESLKQEIPSIESFWDDTIVKNTKEEAKPEESILNIMPKIVQQILPLEQPKNEIQSAGTVINKTIKNSQKETKTLKSIPITSQNIQTKTSVKTSSKPSANANSGGTVMTFEDLTNKIRNQYSNQNVSTSANHNTNNIPQNTQSQTSQPTTQTAIKTNNKTAPSMNLNTNATSTNNSSPQQINQTSEQIVPQKTVKSEAQLKQELVNYKSSLRNVIGKKIDFTRVIGDGECVLVFKVNSNGRLTSKAFVSQSSNVTLNDAAFHALNTTVSYNPPPEAYNGETLKLTIKFYNGNFEISLN